MSVKPLQAVMSAAIIASVVSLTGALFSAKQTGDLNALTATREVLVKSLSDDDLTDLRRQVSVLQSAVRERPDIKYTSPPPSELKILIAKVDKLGDRQTQLENTLTKQPLKALEIPILRRDLDTQAKEVAVLTSALQKAQDSQWETMKWLIGGLAAAIVTIVIPLVIRFTSRSSATAE